MERESWDTCTPSPLGHLVTADLRDSHVQHFLLVTGSLKEAPGQSSVLSVGS